MEAKRCEGEETKQPEGEETDTRGTMELFVDDTWAGDTDGV